jgi:hypothetical protein
MWQQKQLELKEGDINCGYVELVIIEAYGWRMSYELFLNTVSFICALVSLEG